MTASTFQERLKELADQHPQRLAARDGALAVTYAELNQASDALAHRLAHAGAQAGVRVILMADNSAAYLAAAVAVWRTGAVLTTLYASSGPDEVAYALQNSGAQLIVADERASRLVERLDGHPPVVRVGNGVFTDLGETSTFHPYHEAEPEDLALICYTSGSTAHPKAVMHSHSGLYKGAAAYAEVWHLSASDRTIVCLPMAWAFGLVTTSMATLLAGGQVLILSRTKPDLIIDAVSRLGGTFLAGVTTMFVKLTERLEQLDGKPDMGSLRLCISGGEPRNEGVFSRWTARTGCPVHDVYAASECFPAVTYDPTADPIPVLGSSGKVAPGSQMRIVDTDGRDVSPGQPGEALWKGPAQFLGYWQDPEQTRKALTEDGWYRTSDLVRVDERGYVFVEGRLSDMIIRGGSNVSPAEVEGVLHAHPALRAATVVGLPDEHYGERVIAAVILQPGAELDTAELREFCAARMAGYKVPESFIALEALPVNSRTEKVDRRALKAQLSKEGSLA
jgi:long-chain acyl-CoA synthetase